MSKHAELSPSSAARWMVCPGSVALSRGLPDTSSSFAEYGSDGHQLGEICLTTGANAKDLLGRKMDYGNVVDDDMARMVQVYLDYVRQIVATTGGQLFVERSLPIGQITGEDGATGTADAVIVTDDELIIVDLKMGRGVRVDA
jgi:hypothetical protein